MQSKASQMTKGLTQMKETSLKTTASIYFSMDWFYLFKASFLPVGYSSERTISPRLSAVISFGGLIPYFRKASNSSKLHPRPKINEIFREIH